MAWLMKVGPVFMGWRIVHLHPVHRMVLAAEFMRALVELKEREQPNHTKHRQTVEPSLVAIDEKRSQNKVMDKEECQEKRQMAPYHEDFLPIERLIVVAGHTRIKA